jgi:hypothetical protein
MVTIKFNQSVLSLNKVEHKVHGWHLHLPARREKLQRAAKSAPKLHFAARTVKLRMARAFGVHDVEEVG